MERNEVGQRGEDWVMVVNHLEGIENKIALYRCMCRRHTWYQIHDSSLLKLLDEVEWLVKEFKERFNGSNT